MKIKSILFSPALMLVLLVLLSVLLGWATFLENDYGSEYARLIIYNAKWLEFIWLLAGVNLIGRLFLKKTYKLKNLTIFIYHFAFSIILIGAALTRYFGAEGMMHIREGEKSSEIITNARSMMLLKDQDGTLTNVKEKPLDLRYDKDFKMVANVEGQKYVVAFTGVINNAVQYIEPVEGGAPILQLFIVSKNIKEQLFLHENDSKHVGEVLVSFGKNIKADVQVYSQGDSLVLEANKPIMALSSENATNVFLSKDPVRFTDQNFYQIGSYYYRLQGYNDQGEVAWRDEPVNQRQASKRAFEFTIESNNKEGKALVWESSLGDDSVNFWVGSERFALYYGLRCIQLPFAIGLDDFVIERYPGSNSPSSFSSHVKIYDADTEPFGFHIYMNNILKHRGYRFFQSSYDRDEKGTVLSVNHDVWGTRITYFGYFLMMLGMVASLLNKQSFFRKTVLPKDQMLNWILPALLVLGFAQAQAKDAVVDVHHAELFGQILVQNPQGRTEPVHTLASELVRKVARKEKYMGMTPTQIFLEMQLDPQAWKSKPFIRIQNEKLKGQLKWEEEHIPFDKLVRRDSVYMLKFMIDRINRIPTARRSKYDKSILKIDEKVNICYGIFDRDYLKIYPVEEGEEDHWQNPTEWKSSGKQGDASISWENYVVVVNKARASGDYTQANAIVEKIIAYQKVHANYSVPPVWKVKLEIFYYKFNVFKTLFPFYTTLGVLQVFLLIGLIISGKKMARTLRLSLIGVISVAFAFQTAGIIARWIISGHAPMSNGYESMIFVAWVTLFAGFLFYRYSDFALPATTVLAGFTLMVANLSFMDPVITNLVPVLQSYWLTLHVSIITGSYGFLALGMLLGVINLILITLRRKSNRELINEAVLELTRLNHKTIIVGLYMLTIGTFLGAVWANESWGRYWGWDPKETWALISIFVYTIVTHLRFIPFMKGIYTFNLFSVLSFGVIIMTYFGVNYFLSGMHSYGAGDAAEVPSFVVYVLGGIGLLAFVSYVNYVRLAPKDQTE